MRHRITAAGGRRQRHGEVGVDKRAVVEDGVDKHRAEEVAGVEADDGPGVGEEGWDGGRWAGRQEARRADVRLAREDDGVAELGAAAVAADHAAVVNRAVGHDAVSYDAAMDARACDDVGRGGRVGGDYAGEAAEASGGLRVRHSEGGGGVCLCFCVVCGMERAARCCSVMGMRKL